MASGRPLNYTTAIPAAQTVGECQAVLAAAGAALRPADRWAEERRPVPAMARGLVTRRTGTVRGMAGPCRRDRGTCVLAGREVQAYGTGPQVV